MGFPKKERPQSILKQTQPMTHKGSTLHARLLKPSLPSRPRPEESGGSQFERSLTPTISAPSKRGFCFVLPIESAPIKSGLWFAMLQSGERLVRHPAQKGSQKFSASRAFLRHFSEDPCRKQWAVVAQVIFDAMSIYFKQPEAGLNHQGQSDFPWVLPGKLRGARLCYPKREAGCFREFWILFLVAED